MAIPTFQRTERLLQTLAELSSCDPAPAEILVHVDSGDADTAPALKAAYPDVRVFCAETPQGPGGARNRLLQEARHEIVVSLDDDSFPIDSDFFARVMAGFSAHPRAGVLAMVIVHDDEETPPAREAVEEVADFVGCGCAYRREAFLETAGYLPLLTAYGMEEADVALQLIDRGWHILFSHDLRVRHATDRSHQTSPKIVAAHIRNTALLAYLRYPVGKTALGLAQFGNRVLYSTRRGHLGGVLRGILGTPGTLVYYRGHRASVNRSAISTVRRLRKTS